MRRTVLINLALLILMPMMAHSGSWEPCSGLKFRLEIRGAKTAPQTDSERVWVDSLVKKLRLRGGEIRSIHEFGRSTARLFVNDKAVDGNVYVCRNDPGYFFVRWGRDDFFVDFKEQIVLSPGTGGQSIHVPESGAFAVILHPTSRRLEGVPVGGWFRNPSFTDESAKWH